MIKSDRIKSTLEYILKNQDRNFFCVESPERKCNNIGIPNARVVFGNLTYGGSRGGIYGIYNCSFGELIPESTVQMFQLYTIKNIPEHKQHRLKKATAKLDYSSGILTVSDGETNAFITGLTYPQNEYVIYQALQALSEDGVNLIFWEIEELNIPEDQAQVIYASNDQTRVICPDAILDRGNIVYLSMIAHKTAIDSARATIYQGKKTLRVGMTYGVPFGKYSFVITPLPEFSIHHAVMVSNSALPGKWDPEQKTIYAIAKTKEELKKVFHKRLQECLSIPVLDEWDIMQNCLERDMAREVHTDCGPMLCIAIDLEADWTEFFTDLIQEGVIKI